MPRLMIDWRPDDGPRETCFVDDVLGSFIHELDDEVREADPEDVFQLDNVQVLGGDGATITRTFRAGRVERIYQG